MADVAVTEIKKKKSPFMSWWWGRVFFYSLLTGSTFIVDIFGVDLKGFGIWQDPRPDSTDRPQPGDPPQGRLLRSRLVRSRGGRYRMRRKDQRCRMALRFYGTLESPPPSLPGPLIYGVWVEWLFTGEAFVSGYLLASIAIGPQEPGEGKIAPTLKKSGTVPVNLFPVNQDGPQVKTQSFHPILAIPTSAAPPPPPSIQIINIL
jgi:hypothetical protein